MLHHREANGHGLVWMQLCSVSALLNLKFCIEQAREILCQSHPADQISTIALLALRVAYWGLTDWHHLTSIATFQGLSIAHDSESWKSGHLGQSRSLALPDSPKTCTSDGMGLAAVNASRALLRETCPPMLWNKLVHITILHHITILYIYIYIIYIYRLNMIKYHAQYFMIYLIQAYKDKNWYIQCWSVLNTLLSAQKCLHSASLPRLSALVRLQRTPWPVAFPLCTISGSLISDQKRTPFLWHSTAISRSIESLNIFESWKALEAKIPVQSACVPRMSGT